MYNDVCLQCHKWSTGPKHTFCSKECAEEAADEAPRLLRVPRDNIKFLDVERRFNDGWTRGPVPSIKKVYLVTWTNRSCVRFDQYRHRVEQSGRFARIGKAPANERKRFRGAQRACSIGENGNTTICNRSQCRLCETLRYGFGPYLEEKQTTGVNGTRLGAGIYSTYDTSKASNYAVNTWESDVQVLMLCRVILGESFVTEVEQPRLKAPPPGYDSVYARPGRDFSTDERVVYNENAIRPAYLVVY